MTEPRYTCNRTGKRPLAFDGESLANSEEWESQRAWRLELFRTAWGDKYVLAISYVTQWDGETDWHGAEVFDDLDALQSWLDAFDPIEPLGAIGFPPGKAYEERQARLIADLRKSFAERVSDVLRDFPETI